MSRFPVSREAARERVNGACARGLQDGSFVFVINLLSTLTIATLGAGGALHGTAPRPCEFDILIGAGQDVFESCFNCPKPPLAVQKGSTTPHLSRSRRLFCTSMNHVECMHACMRA